MNYIKTLYDALPALSGFQFLIIGVIFTIAVLLYFDAVLPERPPRTMTRDMQDEKIKRIIDVAGFKETGMPKVTNAQAGNPHIRAGSTE